MKTKVCYLCNVELKRNHIALSKKLLGRQVKKYMCLHCLADYLGSTEEDLMVKIEEFKEQGCGLFS